MSQVWARRQARVLCWKLFYVSGLDVVSQFWACIVDTILGWKLCHLFWAGNCAEFLGWKLDQTSVEEINPLFRALICASIQILKVATVLD